MALKDGEKYFLSNIPNEPGALMPFLGGGQLKVLRHATEEEVITDLGSDAVAHVRSLRGSEYKFWCVAKRIGNPLHN